jgi:hypothetical protein
MLTEGTGVKLTSLRGQFNRFKLWGTQTQAVLAAACRPAPHCATTSSASTPTRPTIDDTSNVDVFDSDVAAAVWPSEASTLGTQVYIIPAFFVPISDHFDM